MQFLFLPKRHGETDGIMKAIVAVSKNWGIGKNGKLLFSLPGDMKYFKEKTWGSTVVMGRSTLDSLPGKKPLSGRNAIILSSDTGFHVDGAKVVHSLRHLFFTLRDSVEEIYVIGGESVFKLLLPYCDQALVTKIGAEPEADRFFPNLDNLPNWEVTDQGEEQFEKGLSYRFTTYRNNAVASRNV